MSVIKRLLAEAISGCAALSRLENEVVLDAGC
jgi:hypothetical protein